MFQPRNNLFESSLYCTISSSAHFFCLSTEFEPSSHVLNLTIPLSIYASGSFPNQKPKTSSFPHNRPQRKFDTATLPTSPSESTARLSTLLLTMESAITAAIETIVAVHTTIAELRGTSSIMRRIGSQSVQLHGILTTLHNNYQNHILRDKEMENWLQSQQICNDNLRQVQDILEDYAAVNKRIGAFLVAVRLQFGTKKKLSDLMEDLEKCTKYFVELSGL